MSMSDTQFRWAVMASWSWANHALLHRVIPGSGDDPFCVLTMLIGAWLGFLVWERW